MTAWSSGIGVDDVFICGSPHRDFDVAENRLLVWLLRRMAGAGRRTTGEASKWFEGATLEQVRSQGMAAQRLLAHPTLRGVDGSRRLSSRELRLVRKSRHLAVYAAALKVSDRAAHPFERDEVRRLVSRTTVEDHRVMAMMLDAQRARGLAVPLLSVRDDYIVAGQLRYRCSEVYVDRRKSGTSGLYFGNTRLLTGLEPPEVAASADDYHLVRSAPDADSVITRALTARDAPYSASGLVQGSGSYSS